MCIIAYVTFHSAESWFTGRRTAEVGIGTQYARYVVAISTLYPIGMHRVKQLVPVHYRLLSSCLSSEKKKLKISGIYREKLTTSKPDNNIYVYVPDCSQKRLYSSISVIFCLSVQ